MTELDKPEVQPVVCLKCPVCGHKFIDTEQEARESYARHVELGLTHPK